MYRPTKGARPVGVDAPSSFLEAMEKVFGSRPFILNSSSVPKLSGMAAVYGNATENPYSVLIDLIERHDEIEVWAEY